MTMLVSLAQAKRHLRIDTDAGDADLELKIKGASRAVLNYVQSSDPAWLDTYGEPLEDSNGDAIDIPDDVKAATLILIGDLNKNRDGDNTSEWEHGFLPRAVLCLLYPYRMPTLA